MTITDIVQLNGTNVTFRTGCDYYPKGIEWGEWKTGMLTVHFRIKNLNKSYQRQTRFWKKGDPYMFTFAGTIFEPRPDDYNEDFNTFDMEAYRIEIKS